LIIFAYLASQIPYEYLTPLQAAVGVVQKVKILFNKHFSPISYDESMIIRICVVLFIHVVSGSTAYHTQEYSTKACRTARKMLATGSSSKA
jgi:hypothetical protein